MKKQLNEVQKLQKLAGILHESNFPSIGEIKQTQEKTKGISLYQMKEPLEVENEDIIDDIKKLKRGEIVNVAQYDHNTGLAYLNIGSKIYTTYDLLDTAKYVSGEELQSPE